MAETVREWGERVAGQQRYLLNMDTLVCGPCLEFFDGVERQAKGADGEPVPGPVIRIGLHTLVADPSKFVELEEKEMAFYVAVVRAFSDAIREVAQSAVQANIPPHTTHVLITSAIRMQVLAIDAQAATDFA